jgi:hypothetical protein
LGIELLLEPTPRSLFILKETYLVARTLFETLKGGIGAGPVLGGGSNHQDQSQQRTPERPVWHAGLHLDGTA